MKLQPLLQESLCWVGDEVSANRELLREMADRIARAVPSADAAAVLSALEETDSGGRVATESGVAFPHARAADLSETVVAVALVRGGVRFGGGGPPCDLIFVLAGPADAGWEHLRLLARLARLCHGPGALARLRAATDAKDLYERLCAEDARYG